MTILKQKNITIKIDKKKGCWIIAEEIETGVLQQFAIEFEELMTIHVLLRDYVMKLGNASVIQYTYEEPRNKLHKKIAKVSKKIRTK